MIYCFKLLILFRWILFSFRFVSFLFVSQFTGTPMNVPDGSYSVVSTKLDIYTLLLCNFEVECVSRRSCERRMTDSIGALSRTFGKGRFTLTDFYNYFHNVSIIIYY
jgi:hypothetical protein